MGIFSKFEGKMEDTLEGAASKVFNAPISPVQIAKKAEKQMKRESTKMVGVGKQYAPTLYTVLVNAEDDSNLFGYYPTLAGETETYLAARASEMGLYMDGQPLVRFIVDEGLRHGKFDVIAETVAAPIIAQLRDEEMQRYGLADRQPQASAASYGQQFSRQSAAAQAPAANVATAVPQAAAAAAPQSSAAGQVPYQAPAYQAAAAQFDFNAAAPAVAASAAAPAPAVAPAATPVTPAPAASAAPSYNAAVNPVVTPPTVQGAPETPVSDDYDLQYNDEQFDIDYDADFGDSYDDAPSNSDIDIADPFAATPDNGSCDSYKDDAPLDAKPVSDAPDFSGFNSQAEGYNYNDFDDLDVASVDQASAYAAPAASFDAQNASYAAGTPAPAAAPAAVAAVPNYDNTVVFASDQQAAQSQQAAMPNYQATRGHLTDVATRRSYDLAGSHLIIGRESKNNIVVPDINVSRQHADLRWDPQGVWVLSDLGSTNGTFVNGAPISSCVLQDGDRITFGVTDFVFSR